MSHKVLRIVSQGFSLLKDFAKLCAGLCETFAVSSYHNALIRKICSNINRQA